MIATNIKRLCKDKGVTFAEVERTVGLGNGTIARWDALNPRTDRLKLVADYFGVTVDELLKDDG